MPSGASGRRRPSSGRASVRAAALISKSVWHVTSCRARHWEVIRSLNRTRGHHNKHSSSYHQGEVGSERCDQSFPLVLFSHTSLNTNPLMRFPESTVLACVLHSAAGFPPILSSSHDPASLAPTPAFRTGARPHYPSPLHRCHQPSSPPRAHQHAVLAASLSVPLSDARVSADNSIVNAISPRDRLPSAAGGGGHTPRFGLFGCPGGSCQRSRRFAAAVVCAHVRIDGV